MKKVTEHAQGQWPRILSALAGLSPDQLTDKHQPCPLCGGKDRYRFDDKDQAREFFTRVTGFYKNWNYSEAGTAAADRFLGEIRALAEQYAGAGRQTAG